MRNWAEDQITLVFIRHGATQANKERRYLGKTDESLSEEGIETLELYKMQRLYPDVAYLFTSPMNRCVETAKIIYPALHPVVIPEWEEINFGRFEYRNYEELKDDIQYQAWLNGRGMSSFPEGESRNDFVLRCKSGFIRMCNELSQLVGQTSGKSATVGIIVHGGTIMALLSLYGGTDYFDWQVTNGRGYIVRLTDTHSRKVAQGDNLQIEVVAKI